MARKAAKKHIKKHIIKNKKARMWFKRIRFLFIVISVIILVVITRNSLKAKLDETSAVPASKPVSAEDVKLKSESEPPAPKNNSQNTEPLKNQLSEYLKNVTGHYGIYYRNLDTDDELEINAEDEFTAASTVKLPLNLMLYENFKSGRVDPSQTLTYQKEDYEEGTGVIQSEQFGKAYTFKELSQLSITKSDNIATNMLIRYFTMEKLKEYMRQAGGKVVDDEKNISSPKDMGSYMGKVYQMYQSSDAYSNELMENLLNTDFNDRIPALLPPTVKVAHKIGTQLGVVNDVGIVFADKPYILAVMSKDVTEEDATKVVAEISKKVYDFHDKKQ